MFRNPFTQARPRPTTRRPALPNRCRPHLDPLEGRTLLSLTTFAVDDTQSSLTLSGGVGSIQLMPQGPGSLVAAYTGSLQADVDIPNGALTFIKVGDITAENSGNWQPQANGMLGSEPADYGGQINFLGLAYFALRNVDLRLSSAPLPLTGTGDGVSYSYPNAEHIKMHGGRLAFNHPLVGPGKKGLGRYATDNQADDQGNASYLYDFNGDGSSLELSVAIDISITARIHKIPFTFHLDGVIVATGSLGVVGPTTSHTTKGTHADLGTALATGAHTHGQAVVSESLGHLDNLRAPVMEPAALPGQAPSTPSAGLGNAHTSAAHQVAADLLDAAFVELNPIDHGTIE